ncbi:MAG: phosphoribosylformylglycinamidine synthase [Clostridia bacterium]|nr:phosphoribosylformylglycinamidine synthase [Clostridia bacterium]
MVYRIYVEKKKELAGEAASLKKDIKELLQISSVEDLRIINRYDVEGIEKDLFDYACGTVFSEPQLDIIYDNPEFGDDTVFAVEYLPGQFDQRASSAAECIQLISKGDRPAVRTAKVYVLTGKLSDEEINAVKKYVINPVEAREAVLEKPETLKVEYDIPTTVATLDGFCDLDDEGLAEFIKSYGLAMDFDDIKFCQNYFLSEKRDPTITEIRMIDTYWSDHCRHTTFLTTLENVTFDDPVIEKEYKRYLDTRNELGRTKPVNLMDIATIATRFLKKTGKLQKLDESEEINACTVKIDVNVDGETQKWLLLFKNETHNHPTEIEPFGGAATCIGGAIRDPLSGRSYVYAAMRVTGAADPRKSVSETMSGKLPQRKIVTGAANGYSSYGNQIGLATGIVDEIYHDGYVAKRMEIGAVIAAAPAENVRRECPADGDVVILLGGKTGRDGCGGATGSSKSHSLESLESCGAEVQKGNAPEERKLQRLFRNPEASKLIKRCNDFGAGGVSVAIGELADGLEINLDLVPKKYDGLDGTELAISESQERMAVVVAPEDVDRFCELADMENLETSKVATVKEKPYLVMHWNGNTIVNISREFLNSNGAPKHVDVKTTSGKDYSKEVTDDFEGQMKTLVSDLNVCSKRGLSEQFDSSIGGGTVLMPYGGKNQRTPIQAMVHKISVEKGDTDTCSFMSYGYNPFITEKNPYAGAYLAVVESVSKLVAAGAEFKDVYLTFQEYFEKPGKNPERFGKPLSALLGAFKAQMDLGIASIGGKDSMSGTFEKIDVPPTLVSFAVTTDELKNVISPEFKKAGSKVVLLMPECDENGLPTAKSLIENYNTVSKLVREGKVLSMWTPCYGGIAEAVFKMGIGNSIGFEYADGITCKDIFSYCYGAFVIELADDTELGTLLGHTVDDAAVIFGNTKLNYSDMESLYEGVLEKVFKCNIPTENKEVKAYSYTADKKFTSALKFAKPRILIPVFPGTNCEYDTAKAARAAGLEAEIFVINNKTPGNVSRSVETFAEKIKQSQIVFIPGGFSGGDEPEGSGKLITAFFRNGEIKDAVADLLENRDGLMAGICNGFQALIKLGLVPYGKIIDTDADCATLSFNTISRHQSKIVETRIASNNSPWLCETNVGDIYSVPISHGEGRFIAPEELIRKLAENGQIMTQYVDKAGTPTYDIQFNPNGSFDAIEGIMSPDGRVIGKMGHSERIGNGLYANVNGNYDMGIFRSACKYYK